jgi:hypothetical protein
VPESPDGHIFCGCRASNRNFAARTNAMAALKRRGRAKAPADLLLFVAVSLVFAVGYWTTLTLHELLLPPSAITWAGADVPPAAPKADIDAGFVLGKSSNPADETSSPTRLSNYSRLYGERQHSLLGNNATYLGPEAVERAGEWKRGGDWDRGFLRMNQTLQANIDPPLPRAVTGFQVLPFQVPAVQVPAVPTCCAAR